MPNRSKINPQRVKTHRVYTIAEAAKALSVGQPTVRRWIKGGKLLALTDLKPWLLQGCDVVAFLTAARSPKQKCKMDECFCVKCRKPRRPAADMVEFIPLTPTSGNLRAICPVCERFMHKRVRRATLPALIEIFDVTIAEEPPPLRDFAAPSLNMHFE
jgi:excisionase family DNA binding protein